MELLGSCICCVCINKKTALTTFCNPGNSNRTSCRPIRSVINTIDKQN